MIMADYNTYKLGDFKLKSGGLIPDAFIATRLSAIPACLPSSILHGILDVRLQLSGALLVII